MGNSNTKEARHEHGGAPGRPAHGPSSPRDAQIPSRPAETSDRPRNRQSRFGRPDLNLLNLGGSGGSSSAQDPPYERRETKQEREARRLERERVAREKERERSMKEEHVDGGYLVTLGTYIGTEDFSKKVVRQLQIERKIAPFWRGLNDKDENWTEYQLICAGRGLPIPAADEQPPDEFIPRPQPTSQSHQSPNASSPNLTNLTVPMGPRTLSAGSDRSGSTANASSALASPITGNPQRSSSPFKPRAKALAAALSIGSRNNSSSDISPREINLPHDPLVNGQPLEVFLYKDATECPICFLYYPPYLNRTRCCDQSICSECFVQIKRADPHYPEHHGDEGEQQPNPEESPEMLISEPATCPYCQQTEFGVTYEPPPFRRGLSHAVAPLSSMNTAMSSQSSLNSNMSPGSPPSGTRRRTQSLSANAPNVITTDRVRPDWSSKLAAQRAHQARRAAAATALHTAAFLIGDNNNQSRGFAFTRPGRFSRRNTGQGGSNPGEESPGAVQEAESPTGPEPGPRGSSGRGLLSRRNRMEELEEMMFMEAVRLSLAAEEERKKKQEKAERKEAKKREKEDRKAAKKAEKQGNFYGGGGSATSSSLSLGALGRRRGNSAASNLRMESSSPSAQAGSSKGSNEAGVLGNSGPPSSGGATGGSTSPQHANDKGKGIDRNPSAETSAAEPTTQGTGNSSPAATSLPIPATRGPSHLRQMSNASSISSSLGDSAAGSYSNQGYLDANDPRSSGLSLGGRSDDGDRDATEPMYNFRSLAEMVGVDLENGERTDQQDEQQQKATREGEEAGKAELLSGSDHVEDTSQDVGRERVDESVATLKPETIHEVPEEHVGADEDGSSSKGETASSDMPTPELKITPNTPGPLGDEESDSKRLGAHSVVERSSAITQ